MSFARALFLEPTQAFRKLEAGGVPQESHTSQIMERFTSGGSAMASTSITSPISVVIASVMPRGTLN